MKEKSKKKMSREKRKRMRSLLIKSALVVITTAVVVYFMPRFNSFNYSYDKWQPWRYGTLISTQKFNIAMSDSALMNKKDSISRAFKPFFNHIEVEGNPEDELIMDLQNLDSLRRAGTTYIRVIDGNNAHPVPITDVKSVKEATLSLIGNEARTVKSNLMFDYEKSSSALNEEFSSLGNLGFVRVNEKIVDRGEIITEEIYQKLRSYEDVMKGKTVDGKQLISNYMILLGQIMMVMFICILLVHYLSTYREDYIQKPLHSIMCFSLMTVMCVLASIMVSHHFFHVFILPCCMVPIIIRIFLDSRTAFAFHCGTILLISLTLSNPFEFVLLEMVAGMVAILNLKELTQRSQIVSVAGFIIVSSILFYGAYQLATGAEFKNIELRILIYFVINGFLLLLAYPLIWLIEKTFRFVSDVTLVELSNINHPLLRKLSEQAPGTFQHSMQVANLAADVAKKIGARVQLVRTGALYHDIGKMERPAFFTENQNGVTPHKHLSLVKSAEVIIAHVKNGLALAEKYNIPKIISDFIATHHGLGKTQYFLVTYKNEHPGEEVDETLFQYPGPNPSTKEEAVLMISDAVEAASRSLDQYTTENINNLVDKIIDTQVAEGFFNECPLTFKDITDAKDVLKKRLETLYHTRISYPELKEVKDIKKTT